MSVLPHQGSGPVPFSLRALLAEIAFLPPDDAPDAGTRPVRFHAGAFLVIAALVTVGLVGVASLVSLTVAPTVESAATPVPITLDERAAAQLLGPGATPAEKAAAAAKTSATGSTFWFFGTTAPLPFRAVASAPGSAQSVTFARVDPVTGATVPVASQGGAGVFGDVGPSAPNPGGGGAPNPAPNPVPDPTPDPTPTPDPAPTTAPPTTPDPEPTTPPPPTTEPAPTTPPPATSEPEPTSTPPTTADPEPTHEPPATTDPEPTKHPEPPVDPAPAPSD